MFPKSCVDFYQHIHVALYNVICVNLSQENLPVAGDNDVKVQVKACALSWMDTKVFIFTKFK